MSRIILALTIAAVAPLALPAAPASAACGTSWDSKIVPPDTIRVYRHGKGKVDVVDFKRYVAVVMASEWPSYLPRAAREAGAVAVKQYAWYYALEGHHRPGYVTNDGVCYDVKNTTVDQLYMPSKTVDDRIREAVDATWGLSLRKGGRFFLTGYRSGEVARCGADADGWKLYARSVIDCARDGRSRKEIQQIYYAPRLSFVWADGEPPDGGRPDVRTPKVKLDAGPTLGGAFAKVTWSGSDPDGIARYRLQRSVDGGAWKDVSLQDASNASTRVHLDGGHRYRFRVKAEDGAGNWSRYETGPAYRVSVAQTDRAEFQSGKWRIDEDRSASGSWTRYTRSDGARASFTFTGRGLAYVAPTGPDRGTVRVSIDGNVIGIVDLRSDVLRPRTIVFSKNWKTEKQRTLRIEAVGSDRVDVDAFVVIR